LKEKDFRKFVSNNDWSEFAGKNVAIICSVDAIVPTWAYMLLAVHLTPQVNHLVFGDLVQLEQSLFEKAIAKIDLSQYRDQKVIIKGCSNHPIPDFAYVEITRVLHGVASSIMYGEPCSTVPLFKKSRQQG
jgi:hypothetical protein